ncbi:glycoside hydrolase family 97 protein [Galbibacter pacificus]|uniref:Glycoside hydrolase family 97 catalytic domain-containing protein n=1 Tax=Galbibacter pacificus TaxID=2996052 RepID=A0ABT6FMR9_9FLAO|nr:glycoside hydrolase family 97 protein [Galbibacter pacificus]MDG3581086.1 glycoside hydrolase family 97 catalytic domain-containing protein [Galbibacter pacificus]MDG3584564.1 glycoside hydrolase family 97 catalytic domain-containing protein [Galbibacter pacificus]
MQKLFVKNRVLLHLYCFFLLLTSCTENQSSEQIKLASKNGVNEIVLSLTDLGQLTYHVKRNGKILIKPSPMGVISNDYDFTNGLKIVDISSVQERTEKYQLKVGHQSKINHILQTKSVVVKNTKGGTMVVDLVSGEEGVAFRYRFPEADQKKHTIKKEITGFHIEKNARGWLQPYNKAGDYTPGYEDFYLEVSSGDSISGARNPSVGWCMPALFNVNQKKNWVLIAESATDGSFSGCHLRPIAEDGIYSIAFAKADEAYTLPLDKNTEALPTSKLPWTMPWRVVITGESAGDILLSTLITDLAPASKIEDTSWIETGKASWSWWSHPDDHSPEIYNRFTDLAANMNWKYTLFDAGWEKANDEGAIIDKAIAKGIQPMVWGYSGSYFNPKERKERFKQLADMGIKGVKIDFWCSDRQEVMGALQSLFKDAANQHLLVNLHGTTVPRGWHRTWPNFVTAEAVLGTESYFYEERFPDMAAGQNTILPFTRNVAGPTDYTPVALTMRKYKRLNTAVHELATSMIYTSGVIHFADSKEMLESLPNDVQNLLKEIPATWDHTECIIGEPGKAIVLARKSGERSYIVGINGTNSEQPIQLDLTKYNNKSSSYRIIKEGKNPLMEFESKINSVNSNFVYNIAPKGGFIIEFIEDEAMK